MTRRTTGRISALIAGWPLVFTGISAASVVLILGLTELAPRELNESRGAVTLVVGGGLLYAHLVVCVTCVVSAHVSAALGVARGLAVGLQLAAFGLVWLASPSASPWWMLWLAATVALADPARLSLLSHHARRVLLGTLVGVYLASFAVLAVQIAIPAGTFAVALVLGRRKVARWRVTVSGGCIGLGLSLTWVALFGGNFPAWACLFNVALCTSVHVLIAWAVTVATLSHRLRTTSRTDGFR